MSRGLERLGAFQPSRLRAVRLVVQEQHPGTATMPGPVSVDTEGRVRRLIEANCNDPEELARLGRSFSPREMRACIIALETWEALRPALVVVIRAKPMGTMVPALWRSWQRAPRVEELATLLHELGTRFGMHRAVGAGYADAALAWVSPSGAGIRITRWLDRLQLSYSDIPRLSDNPFTPDTLLLRSVRDAVMTHGTATQLRAEGTKRLLPWSKELRPDDRLAFERNYLRSLKSAEWDIQLVDAIHGRHGLPQRPKRPAFWEPLAEAIRAEFQRIVIDKILSEAFGERTDRHIYWKKVLETDAPRDVTKGKAGTTDYVVIDFGGFVVVEFFEHGNAAYFYSEDQWSGVSTGSVHHPSSLKERLSSPQGLGRDNRVIHSGMWQPKADRMLRLWRKAYR